MQVWQERAACRGSSTELFFPEPSETEVAADVIRTFCHHCPVSRQCQLTADAFRDFGIFGGQLRQAQDKRAAAKVWTAEQLEAGFGRRGRPRG